MVVTRRWKAYEHLAVKLVVFAWQNMGNMCMILWEMPMGAKPCIDITKYSIKMSIFIKGNMSYFPKSVLLKLCI